MKRILIIALSLLLALGCFCGCSQKKDPKTITVGASITPHAEILTQAVPLMAEKGYTLKIVEFTDYVQPNLQLESGDLDANYFQHKPYMDDFNTKNNTHLVSVAAIHYEPFGIYPGKTKTLSALKDGATVNIPNDGTNEARALMLLEAQGLIKLKADAGFTATVLDIAENPKNLKITEIESAQLARTLSEVDIAVINGNYAIQAGMNATTDALATEDAKSEAGETYANIIAVKEGNEKNEAVLALIDVLTSDTITQYINDTYKGAVVPMTK